MPSLIYNRGAELIAKNDLDFESATIDAKLVMSNTTCDTEEDVLTLSGFTTIDECDGSGYVDKTLANAAITRDDANDRIKFDADNVTWSSLGAGTRTTVGILIYEDKGSDATSVPIAYVEFPSAETHTGDDFPVNWHSTNGIFYLQQ